MPIIEQDGIVSLKLILDEMFFMYEIIVQTLNTWIKPFSQEGPSKTVVENIALLMLHFLACSVHLSDVNRLEIEADTYLLEGITKCSVEEFNKPFDMIIQQEKG